MRLSRTLLERLGWTTGGYAVVQALRLINNIILARLLAPELFGMMLLVTTIKIGVELFSDVGVGQNIVRSRNGEKPIFFDTAWTVQVGRGLLLGALFAGLSGPLARFYGDDTLRPVLLVASLFFVVDGFHSTARFLVQKRVDARRYATFEMSVTAVTTVAHVLLALASQSIWALVFGSLFGSCAYLVGSYLLIPGIRHRFVLDRPSLREILSFGKWVFLSSIVYFLAVNFDRLYMGRALGFEVLGLYGITRSLSDIFGQLAARFGGMLIFPLVSAASDDLADLRRRLSAKRPLLLLAAALGLGLFVSVSDLIVDFLYDDRYGAAAAMLPVVCLGVWFAILCAINEAVLLGIGRPSYIASGSTAKLAALLIGLPLAIPAAGVAGAICVIAASEAVRYVPIWVGERRLHLGFARRDAAVTLVFVAVIVASRGLLWSLGLASGLDSLFALPLSFLPSASGA